MTDPKDLVEIFHGNYLQADLAKSILETEGIEVFEVGAGSRHAYNLASFIAPVRLYVRAEEAESAQEVMENMRENLEEDE